MRLARRTRALLALALGGAVAQSIPPFPDTPYTEDVAFRFLAANEGGLPWPSLPVATLDAACGGTLTAAAPGAPASTAAPRSGVFMAGDGRVLFAWITPSSPQQVAPSPPLLVVDLAATLGPLPATTGSHGLRFAVDPWTGALRALAGPGWLWAVNCSSTAACAAVAQVSQPNADVVSGLSYTARSPGASGLLGIAGDAGLFTASWPAGSAAPEPLVATSVTTALNALAFNASSALDGGPLRLAAGGADRLYQLVVTESGGPTGQLLGAQVDRWDWVTDVATGSGGVVDDVVTSLSFDGCGTLWIGTPTCLDVMYANGTVDRLNGLAGLPVNDTRLVETEAAWVWTEPNPGASSSSSSTSSSLLSSSLSSKRVLASGGWARVVSGSVWAGATQGLSRYIADPTADGVWFPGNVHGGVPASACIATAGSAVGRDQWRYYWGNRWLPQGAGANNTILALAPLSVAVSVARGDENGPSSSSSTSFSTSFSSSFSSSSSSSSSSVVVQPAVFAATPGGASILVHQAWTLADKAAWYSAMVPRHDRFGFVVDCGLPSPGNLSTLSCGPGESDGIWTSVMLAAEAAEFAVTGSATAQARAQRRINALAFLFNVTNSLGYPARSVSAPSQPQSGGWWQNSTTVPGWFWLGNTSADSFTGDLFGLGVAWAWLGNATGQEALLEALVGTAVRTTVHNGYVLLENNRTMTRWGIWSPAYVDGLRDWSDQRGLNALQMLSYLHLANTMVGDADGTLSRAWTELTNATNQYDQNVVNEEILAPIDDNYSDLELAFLPYYAMLGLPTRSSTRLAVTDAFSSSSSPSTSTSMANELREDSAVPAGRPPLAVLGVSRSWSVLRSLRASLWNVLFLASVLPPTPAPPMVSGVRTEPSSSSIPSTASGWPVEAILRDVVWNLQTWPLEQISWGTRNDQRIDIWLNPEPDRDGNYNTQTERVLPCRERSQYRWNANPYEIPNSDSGMSEYDPGAWLAPYWLARAHGFLGA